LQRYYRLSFLILALVIGAAFVNYYIPLTRGLDLAGGTRVIMKAKPEVWQSIKPDEREDKMDAVLRTIRRRVQGVARDPVVQRQGENRVIVELPGVTDPEKAIEILRSTAKLEFYWLKDVKYESGPPTRNPYAKWTIPDSLEKDKYGNDIYRFIGPKGEVVQKPEEILEKVVNVKENPPILTGADLKPNAASDLEGSKPIINIQFNERGTKIFREFTRRHVHDILAIFFDGKILTAPRINEPIPSGRAQISGFADLDEAQQKAEFLNAGALPIPLDVEGQDSVEASLGRETVSQAIVAGLVGLGLVLIFMLLYYRLPGAIADIALALYALFSLAAFRLFGVTMTLPGLAGFILSIGMAVDANILIFERLKEELRSGKTLRAAIEAGFARAFTAIFDSNMCTAITCAILMWFGTGQVFSFAFVLLLGVIISMFTAITVTRTILFLLVNWDWAQKPWLFGLATSWFARTGRQLDVIGKRNWYFALSGTIIAIGLFFLITSGLKPGIEFTSGSALQVTFKRPVTASEVGRTISRLGVPNMVQISEGKTAFIRMRELRRDSPKLASVREALKRDFGEYGKESFSYVGPTISAELIRKAVLSIVIASVLIVMYLSGRFAIGGVASGVKFGVCAVAALIHDVLVITGMFAVLGALRGWEIDSLFVTALLTIIGFSVHDTIVVFDRIRENLKHRLRGETFEALANRSILQTFSRSINTSLTVLLTLGALIALGGPIIQHFYIALFAGIVAGTYSSIFNATPLVVVWERIGNRGRAPARRREERAMITEEMAKQLRSIAEATGGAPIAQTEVTEDRSEPPSPAQPAAARTKVKPKKKKRRF